MTRRLAAGSWLVLAGVAAADRGCEFDGAYDLPLPGSPVDADDAIEVTAEFEDILNIVPRSPVMVDDVTVGEVTDVERVGWHAKITMRVRKDVDLPDNAIAEIRQVSLLGEKYVALEPPAGGRLGGPARRRRQHPALARPAATPRSRRCSARCRSCSAAAAWPSSAPSPQELNKAMSGREEDLRHLLGSLTDVVGTLDDQKADIIRAMESVNNLTATLNAREADHHRRARRRRPGDQGAGRPARRAGRDARPRSTGSAWSAPG